MARTQRDYAHDYTKPKLRERLKEKIKRSDRGGPAGRWSARKSQLLTQEYEHQGGGYRHPSQPTNSQRSLREWTEQDWQTADGSTRARGTDGTDRYLPRTAWEDLSEAEKERTRTRKKLASRAGKQVSDNTPAARNARRAAELDELNAADAAKRAGDLDGGQAEAALDHERRHKARKTVLRRLERIVGRGH